MIIGEPNNTFVTRNQAEYQRLVDNINRYWAEKAGNIKARVIVLSGTGFAIVSDSINGMPR